MSFLRPRRGGRAHRKGRPDRAGAPRRRVQRPHRRVERGLQRRGRLCRRYRAVSAGAGAGKQRLRRPGGQRLPGGLRPAGVLQGGREAVTILQTIAVAFAMFSALPVPQFGWNEKNMRYAMCAFPLIGLVCGGLWCLCGVLPLPDMARAAAFCLVPVAVTGGIHLDGYADTSDALLSYGDREKKARDPEGFSLRCLCRHPVVQLFCRLLRPLRQCAVHPPCGAVLDAGAGAGTGAVRLCRGGVPAGEGYRPCPHLRHGGGQADRPPFPLRGVGPAGAGADGAGGWVLWRQRRFWR